MSICFGPCGLRCSGVAKGNLPQALGNRSVKGLYFAASSLSQDGDPLGLMDAAAFERGAKRRAKAARGSVACRTSSRPDVLGRSQNTRLLNLRRTASSRSCTEGTGRLRTWHETHGGCLSTPPRLGNLDGRVVLTATDLPPSHLWAVCGSQDHHPRRAAGGSGNAVPLCHELILELPHRLMLSATVSAPQKGVNLHAGPEGQTLL